MTPLNPRPRRKPLDPDHDVIVYVVSHCNACERPIVDGEEFVVSVVAWPDGHEGSTTIACHVPECPT